MAGRRVCRRPPCGLIAHIKEAEQPIPLKEVSVEAEIKACLLGLKSVLKYTNESSDPVEVMFRFPLEDTSAVVGLTAIIDGRKIKADIRDKEEAKAAYDDAIASGQSAALAEEKTGDVFSVTLGNLPPHKDAEVHLQVVAELPIDAEGNIRFSLPSVFKPRYTPTDSTDPLADVAATGTQVSKAKIAGFSSFQLNVLEPEHISEITSPTHTLNCTDAADNAVVTLTDQTPADKDMVILIKRKEPHRPSAVVEEGNGMEGGFMSQKAVMVNFFPDFKHTESQCEFIFLVDRSGSMRGSFIESARDTLILFLKSLPEGSYFNIIGFGSRYEELFRKGSVPYTQENLDMAEAHLSTLQANLGGTELRPPLQFIFQTKPPAGLSRQVFVLTDGAVSNIDQCVKLVKEHSESSRCFTFGIGSGASTALVEGLARAGNGSAEFVKEGERLQPKVIRSLKRALQPAVTDVSLKFEIKGNPKVLQCPQSLPPIFAGEKLVVYAVVETKKEKIAGKAVLKGKLIQKPISDTIEIESSTPSSSVATVHHLAAKALIKDWEREGKGKEEIVKLSVESSVVSSYTAFVAVDEENSKPIKGALKTWDVQAHRAFYGAPRSFGGGGGGRGGGVMYKMKKKGAAPKSASARRMMHTTGSHHSRELSEGCPPPAPIHMSAAPGACARPMFSESSMAPSTVSSAYSPADIISRGPLTDSSEVSLSTIIGAQQADGSWRINESLARFVGKSLQEVESGCLVECKDVVGLVWATLLILELLHSQYADDQEEWELVGAKAESWTKKQSLPEGITLDAMKDAAKKLIKTC